MMIGLIVFGYALASLGYFVEWHGLLRRLPIDRTPRQDTVTAACLAVVWVLAVPVLVGFGIYRAVKRGQQK